MVAALFNFIGSLLIGCNLPSFQMMPRYPLVLDSIAVVCFIVGAVLAVFDIEVCVSDIERTNLHILMTIEYTLRERNWN